LAEKTPLEEIARRAYDANLRYWEAVGRATSEYVQAVSRLWADAPLAWAPQQRGPTATAEPSSYPPPALLLEGAAGSEARSVVMLTNDLTREVEAGVVASSLTGPGGETAPVRVHAEPEVVKLAPGSRTPVTLSVQLTDALAPGVDYRGEVNVPGLSPRGVAVIVRRTE